MKVLALGEDGELLAEESAETLDDGSERWRQRAREAVRGVMGPCAGPVRVGVAAPGLPARDGSGIAVMPGRLAGLEGLNWQEWLELDWPVPVFNDGQAALLGECWLGAAKGATNVVM